MGKHLFGLTLLADLMNYDLHHRPSRNPASLRILRLSTFFHILRSTGLL